MLIARVYSAGEALDPSRMTVWQKTFFLISWWWVGLATFPRTIKEALTLLLRRGMKWAFRPEPRSDTISRQADATEQIVEVQFRRYLRHLVENSQDPVALKYIPSGLVGSDAEEMEEIMLSPSAQLTPPSSVETLSIRVLTPLFYTRLVQYPSVLKALLSEHAPNAANPTIGIENLKTLTCLDFKAGTMFNGTSGTSASSVKSLSFKLISRLRRDNGPAAIPHPEGINSKEGSLYPAEATELIGNLKLRHNLKADGSVFDKFVLHCALETEKKEYVTRVVKLLLAERVALGWMEILDLQIFIFRCILGWAIVRSL